jgi:hypothetical protein
MPLAGLRVRGAATFEPEKSVLPETATRNPLAATATEHGESCYLYGDSSASPFTSNLLEFLRDAIDFSVYVLEADQRIRSGKKRMDALRLRTDAELHEVEVLRSAALATIEGTPKGANDSPASECAVCMKTACDVAAQSVVESVQKRLADALERAQADEDAEREGCLNALAALVVAHPPPDSSCALKFRVRETGAYQALLEGTCTPLAVTWRCELGFPEGHPFTSIMRVGQLQQSFQIVAPELTGWIKKEVRMRPQQLERHAITEVVAEGSKVALCLRTEPGSDDGYDFEWQPETDRVVAARVLATDDPRAGRFELLESDAPKLVALCQAVRGEFAQLKTIVSVEARLGERDFRALPTFVEIVERLVEQLSPITHEIARHSLEPNELVLRRALGDGRREEIFVSKTTLREKYETLATDLQPLFAPLGLREMLSRSMAPPGFEPTETGRSELPPSNPPPPPAKPIQEVALPPPPISKFARAPRRKESGRIEDVSDASGNISAAPKTPTGGDAGKLPPAEGAVPPNAMPRADEAKPRSAGLAASSAAKAAPLPKANAAPRRAGRAEKEQLLSALSAIVALAKGGRVEDAYRDYAALCGSPLFADQSPEEQRQALKLLVVLAVPAIRSDAMRDAHRAALDRARALVESMGDPADYELVGLCQMALNEAKAGGDTFRKALDLERARNPQSELCARLKRHVSASESGELVP